MQKERRDGAWDLTMAKDAENTSNEKRSSTWFYFRVRDEREGPKRQARFRFAGMARQANSINTAIDPWCVG